MSAVLDRAIPAIYLMLKTQFPVLFLVWDIKHWLCRLNHYLNGYDMELNAKTIKQKTSQKVLTLA